MTVATVKYELIEGAVDAMIATVRAKYNAALESVFEFYRLKGAPVDMQRLEGERVYETEMVEPIQCPAVFITPASTVRNLRTQDRNTILQDHDILITILVEGADARLLTRKAWRYGLAMNNLFHEESTRGPRGSSLVFVVASVDYSPVYMQRHADPSTRSFRKDTSLRMVVRHGESFE